MDWFMRSKRLNNHFEMTAWFEPVEVDVSEISTVQISDPVLEWHKMSDSKTLIALTKSTDSVKEVTKDLQDTSLEPPTKRRKYPNGQDPRLKYHEPYWWPYRTFVKER
jgi:hypothetical protein